MSRAGRTRNAWGVAPEVDEARRRSVQIPVVVAAVLLAMPGVLVPGVGIPVSEFGGLALAALALVQRPVAKVPAWLTVLLAGVVGIMALSSLLNDAPTGLRRVAHLAIWALLAWGLASGRLHVLSVVRGIAIGLVVATSLSIVGLGTDAIGYEGRLTGLYADPNVAGYYQVVLGAAVVTFVAGALPRTGFVGLLVAGVYRTLSRTSMLAALTVAFWVTIGRRLGRVGALMLVIGLVYAVDNLPDQLRLFGPFAQREGSDALRERIIAEENAVIASAPWYGNGGGTARVLIDDRQFFFHNSYLAALNEGGWLLLSGVVLLLGLTFWTLFHPSVRHHRRTPWLHASLIATAVCAVSLGEVLLDLPTAVAIGLGVAQRTHLSQDPFLGTVGLSSARSRPAPEDPGPGDRTPPARSSRRRRERP